MRRPRRKKAAREKRYAKYQKQKELMAQQQMNGGGRNDRKPQPKKKKQGGEEKHSGTNENGRVGQRPYARGRAYDEKALRIRSFVYELYRSNGQDRGGSCP